MDERMEGRKDEMLNTKSPPFFFEKAGNKLFPHGSELDILRKIK